MTKKEKKTEKKEIKDLKWIRLYSPWLIPRYLIEQIKRRDYEIDAFLEYQNSCIMVKGEKGPILNPLSHLYGMTDKENLTKGFLWFTVDPLSQSICIHVYSVDPEYWNNGAIEHLSNFVLEIKEKANLKKVYWITDCEKHSLKHGFKRSKSVLMEYDESDIKEILNEEGEEDGSNTDGRDISRRVCKSTHS